GWVCSLPASYQATETLCDGLDNDCDGTTDEGCLTPTTPSDLRVDRGDTLGSNNSVQPVIEGNGGARAFAAWMDQRGTGGAHIYYSRYSDATDTFATPIRLDSSNGPAIGPRIAVSSASVLTGVWADFRGGTNYREIYSTRSTNTGASFGGNVRLNPGQNRDSFNVEVAQSGSRVYVVYEVFTSARNRHIYLARSSNSGASFSAPVRIDHGDDVAVPGFVAATPVVAASGSRVYVVWRDNRNGGLDIYLSRSVNSGASFGAADQRVDLGDAPGASSGFSPTVAAEGDNVYVAWVDDRSGSSFDVYFNRSTDAGSSFLASAVNVDGDSLPHDTVEPTLLAPSPGVVLVGFVDYRFGFPDVFARRSPNAGMTFAPAARLDTGTLEGASGSFELRLAAEGPLIGAVFSDERDGMLDIYANYSLDGGQNWQPSDVRLDSTAIPGSSDSVEPDVAVSGGALRAVWVDHRSGANGDIYGRVLR
ncbi:MAG: exo-alpha-sialidase, partial [Deltaproteobacteria bacterium]|nr:exo-alpha-sialidase [Deltaproteobacteria bacterium]